MILTPNSRAYSPGDKYAHVIREVDVFALPWCEASETVALLPVVDGGPASPKLAPEGMPTCVACLAAMGQPAAQGPSPGRLVREERLERGWTQADLATALGSGFTAVMVSHLECGRKIVDKPLAHALARVFGVPAREWLRLQNVVDLERVRRVA